MPRHRTPACLINVDDYRDPGYETIYRCESCDKVTDPDELRRDVLGRREIQVCPSCYAEANPDEELDEGDG